MSRAFVRDDADNERVLVPQRAPLPDGMSNLVTPKGMAALRNELSAVRSELARLHSIGPDEPGRARDLTSVQERLAAIEDRIASAQMVEPSSLPPKEVGFGTIVTVRRLEGKFTGEQSRFTIVGVDEADPLEGLVAFTAPMVKALLGQSVGATARISTGGQDQLLEVLSIENAPT